MVTWPKWVPDGNPEARRERSAWINAHANEYHPRMLRAARSESGCPVAGCPWVVTEWEIRSPLGWRTWTADDADHAREQHHDAFPEEAILAVRIA